MSQTGHPPSQFTTGPPSPPLWHPPPPPQTSPQSGERRMHQAAPGLQGGEGGEGGRADRPLAGRGRPRAGAPAETLGGGRGTPRRRLLGPAARQSLGRLSACTAVPNAPPPNSLHQFCTKISPILATASLSVWQAPHGTPLLESAPHRPPYTVWVARGAAPAHRHVLLAG